MTAALLSSCADVSYSCLLLYYLLYLILMFSYMLLLSLPTQPIKSQLSEVTFFNNVNLNIKKCKIEINSYNVLQIFIFGFGLVTLLCLFYFHQDLTFKIAFVTLCHAM